MKRGAAKKKGGAGGYRRIENPWSWFGVFRLGRRGARIHKRGQKKMEKQKKGTRAVAWDVGVGVCLVVGLREGRCARIKNEMIKYGLKKTKSHK